MTASLTPWPKRLREKPVQLERFRRRVRSRKNFSGNVIFDRSDESGLAASGIRRMDSSRKAVVLFPFVPVIPVLAIRSAGRL